MTICCLLYTSDAADDLIGVGPGDKELLTVKAVRTIEKCDVIVAPSAEEGGDSIALETAREYIRPDTEIVIKHFPMGKKNRVIKALEAYEFIESRLKEGKNVAFLTIGDPYIYSTYSHMLNHLRDDGFEVKTIPEIPNTPNTCLLYTSPSPRDTR